LLKGDDYNPDLHDPNRGKQNKFLTPKPLWGPGREELISARPHKTIEKGKRDGHGRKPWTRSMKWKETYIQYCLLKMVHNDTINEKSTPSPRKRKADKNPRGEDHRKPEKKETNPVAIGPKEVSRERAE